MWAQPRAPRPAQPSRVMPSQWQRDSFSSAAQSAPVGAKAQDPRAERQGEQHKKRFPSRSTPGSRQWKPTGTAQLRKSSDPDDARDTRRKRGYTDLQTRSPVRAPTAACAHGSSGSAVQHALTSDNAAQPLRARDGAVDPFIVKVYSAKTVKTGDPGAIRATQSTAKT